MNNKDNSQQVKRYQYIVFFVWLIFIFMAGKYFIYDRLVAFDPNNKLNRETAAILADIKNDLVLNNKLPTDHSLKKTIIHFTSANCSCTDYSDEHKRIIDTKAVASHFDIINIELAPQGNNIIPSTPAILMIDENNDLLYLGPYTEGLDCSANSSIVDIVLSNYNKGFNSPLVINNTKGCYCNI